MIDEVQYAPELFSYLKIVLFRSQESIGIVLRHLPNVMWEVSVRSCAILLTCALAGTGYVSRLGLARVHSVNSDPD